MAASNAGRKPEPANLKLLKGRHAGADSGGRKVKQPPGFKRLPPKKPVEMSPAAGDLWDEIVEELQRLQLTKPLDGPALEMACETYSRWYTARQMRLELGLFHENSQGRVTAPWVGVEERAAKEFRAFCSEFGLTPSAEARLNPADGGDADESPFA